MVKGGKAQSFSLLGRFPPEPAQKGKEDNMGQGEQGVFVVIVDQAEKEGLKQVAVPISKVRAKDRQKYSPKDKLFKEGDGASIEQDRQEQDQAFV